MNVRPILIFGKQGQVASSLAEFFPQAIRVGKDECDFLKPDEVRSILEKHKPHLVINPAAFTDVDKSEIERERAHRINSEVPGVVGNWCAKQGASLIHYSTDYVYSGTGSDFWKEESAGAPVNFYGRTKLEGENAILASGCHAVILRTSWVFSPTAKNFLSAMMRAAAEKEEVRVVDDQFASPTFARDLAQITFQVASHSDFKGTSGAFNAVNSGVASRYQFANEIFRLMREHALPVNVKRVHPVPTQAFPTPAVRPLNSRLDLSKLRGTFGICPRLWKEALAECLSHFSGQCQVQSLR